MFRIIKEKVLQKIRNARIEIVNLGNQIKIIDFTKKESVLWLYCNPFLF